MALLDDIEVNEDFYAVSLAHWNKLVTLFGGAPEIPIYFYSTTDSKGEKVYNHDFKPLKIKIRVVDCMSD